MQIVIAIDIHKGKSIEKFADDISRLRIEAFREYPYLYDGNLEYEQNYIKGYTQNPEASLVVANIEEKIVGFLTGIPLSSDFDLTRKCDGLFLDKNINIKSYYYYGEIIILPQYRGLGLHNLLPTEMDKVAMSMKFQNACFLSVVRPENHPLKPTKYRYPGILAERNGYKKMNLCINYQWPTILPDGQTKDAENILEFWSKPLEENKKCFT